LALIETLPYVVQLNKPFIYSYFFLLQSYANVLKYCHIFFLKIYHCYDTVLKYKVSFNANMHTQKARLVGSTQFSCFYY
jgi:hypothetical protein